MKKRQYLKKSILLYGKSNGEIFSRRFIIVNKLNKGEGAFSVCYEAYYEEGGSRGILKEFYPLVNYALERMENGQLIHSAEFGDMLEAFKKAKEEYIEPYKMLMETKRNGQNEDLATFIPSFEIYYGCDENSSDTSTVYIWTPDSKVETFDKICHEIHKHPQNNPEHKLLTVLTAIESLTKCICALHMAEMVHCDINPCNFGFIHRGNETLTQTLSLFDINSICSVYGKSRELGTEGYIEPEAGYKTVSNKTDIYSIGATLFHAIIVTNETEKNGFLYNSDYYDRLHEMVDESRLIKASEANSHPRLRNILTRILRKCLCERIYRYTNCEELQNDLEKALYYVLPSDIARKNLSKEKWILADAEKSLDTNKEKNSFLAIQYHLYEYPLYQYSSDEEENINVLIIGFGNYGQKFSDACLQNGQMRNKKLQITVISDDETDKEIYLSERPQLADFFNIDGSLQGNSNTYGDIIFMTAELEYNNFVVNSNVIQKIIQQQYNNKPLHYIFIALEEDNLNLAMAKVCQKATKVLKTDCAINYVCKNIQDSDKSVSALYPVYVNRNIRKSAFYPEIERMAFNTHLVWEKNLNVDYKEIKADFQKAYCYDSCVSNVLSLKYKLYSIGIDLSTVSFEEAARQVKDIITNTANLSVKNELIWIEHRRWVTEKLCLGWQSIQNLEDCAYGMTRDERHKKHICILKSRPDQKLAEEYTVNNYEKWDTASNKELLALDDLDRMSVELHRMYKRKTETVRIQNLLSGNIIFGIRTLIEGHKEAMITFQEWFTCIKEIANRDETSLKERKKEKVYLYKGLKQSFLSSLKSLPKDSQEAVEKQVKAFETIFYPVLASMEYQIWKQNDVEFINHIPFILTYSENSYLVIPYASVGKNEIFGNVAVATVINPKKILYIVLFEQKQDISKFLESLSGVITYMNKKKFRTVVDFVLIYTEALKNIVIENLENEIKETGKGRIRLVNFMAVSQIADVPTKLITYLKQRRIGKNFFAMEKNRTSLSYMLQITPAYNEFSSYRFTSHTMKFEDLFNCDMLNYIIKFPSITVSDMMALQCSASESSNNPEFFQDYKKLWRKYQNKNSVWKALCDTLKRYASTNDIIASFSRVARRKDTQAQTYSYILPVSCNRSVNKILSFLKKNKILENESCMETYTTDSCKITIVDCYHYREEYDKLFSNVYALMNTDDITAYANTIEHTVIIAFDNLVVSQVKFNESQKTDLIELMTFFKEMQYIINFISVSEDTFSFTYASKKIKELLTTSGKMLEIYTYHKVKELGQFDDVVCNYEVNWEGTKVKSEFDCIITKNFSSLFVECKACSHIQQNYYYKIAELKNKFGINATAVLIADTQEKSFYDTVPVNSMQCIRGDKMNVVTIRKPEEIENIGNTLLHIINREYGVNND